ncbi:MAG: Hsp20/alpha crystallin family protein [Desulfobulbus sp.]|nr:Hsp20/alpha crystallin family protein [Desulfobulbus sp.]
MAHHWHDIHHLFGAMDFFRNQMNSLLQDADRSYITDRSWGIRDGFPRTNLSDTGDNLELFAEVPGVSKEKLNVKIQGNYLEISGTRLAASPEGYTLHRNERVSSSFSRSFTLPYEVDATKVTATLNDGILKIVLPKSEAAKPRQVTIS